MRREFSAGGVVFRRLRGQLVFAALRPAGRGDAVWALPKGLIDAGETALETALREVAEEIGVEASSLGKLGDVRYVYTWKGDRVFKVVSFFLMRYRGGRLGELPEATRHEVAEVRWLPLEQAQLLLSYGGERDMAARALARLATEAL